MIFLVTQDFWGLNVKTSAQALSDQIGEASPKSSSFVTIFLQFPESETMKLLKIYGFGLLLVAKRLIFCGKF